jgi:AAA domain
MRIRSVTAHAFGPLAGEILEFADGMTVVVGDNESGKTSWHAAIYAALCGRRRGSGRPRENEQRFIEAHRPWDREDWLVTAQIVLDDGRRIEMRQDLAGKVDCHAVDLDIAQDVSAQIMNEGTPDASLWLGLDRNSFSATACVEQAQMLQVRSEAGGLQQYLQRAAATAGADATAAAALQLIAGFEREQVGLDRANSTRPLRRALGNVQAAEENLETARRAHEEYLRLAERADHLTEAARTADSLVGAYQAAAAADQADRLAGKADQARALHDQVGDTAPPSVADDDAVAARVAGALAAWRTQPDEPALSGLTSEQLRDRLGNLDQQPEANQPAPRSSVAYMLAAAGIAIAGIVVLTAVSKITGVALLIIALIQRKRSPYATAVKLAAERARLQAELAARLSDEDRARQDRCKRDEVARMAAAAAASCGLRAPTSESAVEALRQWSTSRNEHLRQVAARQEQWTRFQALLNGKTLGQLAQDAAAARKHAAALAASADTAMTSIIEPAAAAGVLPEKRDHAREAAEQAARARGDLDRYAAQIASVPEAEETLAAAEAELGRIRDLQQTLILTRGFLEAAQQRIHRDIAPARCPAAAGGRGDDPGRPAAALSLVAQHSGYCGCCRNHGDHRRCREHQRAGQTRWPGACGHAWRLHRTGDPGRGGWPHQRLRQLPVQAPRSASPQRRSLLHRRGRIRPPVFHVHVPQPGNRRGGLPVLHPAGRGERDLVAQHRPDPPQPPPRDARSTSR